MKNRTRPPQKPTAAGRAAAAHRKARAAVAAKTKRDWNLIRRQYVEGIAKDGAITWPSLDTLAAMYSCHPPYMRSKATVGSWVLDRDQFQAKVDKERMDRRAVILGTEGAAFDALVVRTASKAIRMLDAQLDDIARPMTDGTRRPLGVADMDQVRGISSSLRNFAHAGKVSLGETEQPPAPPPVAPVDTPGKTVVEVRVIRDDAPAPRRPDTDSDD